MEFRVAYLALSARQVQLYASAVVRYESAVNWRTARDVLHCAESFSNRPRYDGVLFQDGPDRVVFARLVCIFRCYPFGRDQGDEKSLVAALVHPFDAQLNGRRYTVLAKHDEELGLYRVRPQSRSGTIIIHVASIIRGAYLVEDYGDPGHTPYLKVDEWRGYNATADHFVMDLLDEDMFIRMQTLPYVGRRAF